MRRLTLAPRDRRTALRLAVGIGALAAAAIFLRQISVPSAEGVVGAVRALGPLAPAALVLLYVPWLLVGLPTQPLTLAAGFAFGVAGGGIVGVAGLTCGSSVALLAARGIARPTVERLCARVPAFAPLRGAVAAHGFRVVLLLRLAPVMPVPFLSHLLGLTPVRLAHFVPATVLGTMPSTTAIAAVGALLRSTGARPDVAALRVEGVALAAALLASGLLAVAATRVLAREIESQKSRPANAVHPEAEAP